MFLLGVQSLGKAYEHKKIGEDSAKIEKDESKEESESLAGSKEVQTDVTVEMETDSVQNVTCFLMMIDLILKQVYSIKQVIYDLKFSEV